MLRFAAQTGRLMMSYAPKTGARTAVVVPRPSASAMEAVGGYGNTRSFWKFGSNKDDNGGKNDDKKKEEQEKDKQKDEEGGQEDPQAPDNTTTVSQLAPGETDAVTRAGVGENAPRIPSVVALPLRRPVFPWFIAHVATKDQRIIRALKDVQQSRQPYVGLFMEKDRDEIEENVTTVPRSPEELYQVGTLASLQTLSETPEGGIGAWFLSHRRIRMLETLNDTLPPTVSIHHYERQRGEANTDMVRALSNEILHTIRNVVRINPMMKEQMQYFMQRLEVHDSYKLADFAASMTSSDPQEAQKVLEAENLEERLQLALELLRKEEDLSKLQQKIQQQVDDKMKESQRKYFLHEQLKAIKKELGLEKDDKDALVQKFKSRVENLDMPESARKVFDEEIEKLEVLERNSSEFNVTRSYLDWLSSLPWGKYSTDNFDLSQAKKILDEDHYGMKDVKDRILEFIAVGKLKGSVQGKIMCLVGPPGVGKTSIGRSIARSLERKFNRFSVGGLGDVAEIKGHRRTYIGAMPGKLIQCMKTTEVANPLILIDEVDKIGAGRFGGGDPASALLEMLDPNQNYEFTDHYLDTPLDASKVLFLCTANTTETIPGPLLDRMEVIEVSGYDGPEKIEIAKRYLDPKTRSEVGLEKDKPSTPKSLELYDDALESLIRWYCRESGVRSLEKQIGKIYRKAALKIIEAREKALQERGIDHSTKEKGSITTSNNQQASSEERTLEPEVVREDHDCKRSEQHSQSSTDTVIDATQSEASQQETEEEHIPLPEVDEADWGITAENLDQYCGKRIFSSDRLYERTPPGVVMGLAWTNMGGSALYIETTIPNFYTFEPDQDENDKKSREYTGSLKLTGKMGDVMQESASIAHTLARRTLCQVPGYEHASYLEHASVHMHVPEGATPKDGPSAGCTMTTSLLSLATGMPVKQDMAMTGEVTLTGKVLPVGGIKEKTMAARRSNIHTLVLPSENKKDYEELPDHLKEGMEVHFAETYDDVFYHAFGMSLNKAKDLNYSHGRKE
eukprot:gb/GECG01004188.1/.p1 GENE.gb/GECG01004188.1/~~gb/GECG01004188.1/.p1  ORF type:complete len:1020 (+),score=187.42 gb/GECG01004188.1/:1-3060(+)